ncbi:hypothetical protein AWJ20_64 [Sugiyamaella lignohabitans]|uniref:Uncharacterized protein n=1 Tax=Sugiyamaella lignohabitans TaxID=796027 RepID=A0A167CL47_9ASCO|nr:uncharacterized protein AWJ20_64 [Sugiyamaella lignohabitans]ANB11840.1 hypothetical protein AWJ20_64 [Sugiyamaella lignohabitans]
MITPFSFFRRSKRETLSAKPVASLGPCICTRNISSQTGSNSVDLTSPLEPTDSRESSSSLSSSCASSNLDVSSVSQVSYPNEPPCPKGGSEDPIFLPNEVLLQRFSNRKSGLKLSKWKMEQQRLKCRRCSTATTASTNPDNTSSTSGRSSYTAGGVTMSAFAASASASASASATATSTTSRCNTSSTSASVSASSTGNTTLECTTLTGSTGSITVSTQCPASYKYSSSGSTTAAITENCHDELSDQTHPGVIYVTSERLIFVPKSELIDGYTLDITSLSCMKAIESTKRVWFFVCYKDNNSIATIPFSSQARCQAFLRLIKNIRFEHMVRQCLPPRYTHYSIPEETNSTMDTDSDSPADSNYTLSSSTPPNDNGSSEFQPDEWWYGDNQLPSYNDSEEALHKYLTNLGLLTETEPLDRTERISRLIALATVPQSVALDDSTSTTTSSSSSNRSNVPRTTQTAAAHEAYHSPYVWF